MIIQLFLHDIIRIKYKKFYKLSQHIKFRYVFKKMKKNAIENEKMNYFSKGSDK